MAIKEFALAIGVSATTVSRSISQRGRISEETRRMVLPYDSPVYAGAGLHAEFARAAFGLWSGRHYHFVLRAGAFLSSGFVSR